MFGGLKKSASRLALVAAAGVLSTGAYAADLGGDCCADLEERVAELEATVAKKGNRRMSLQVYGWVNKTIMHWNAPTNAAGTAPVVLQNSGTYLGLDNTNSATRFGFRGDAKISPAAKAGYSILLDVFTGGTTARASRVSEDGAATVLGGNTTSDDNLIRMRDANVWLEHSSVGRVTLGRLTGAGAVGVIDLGGIGNVAPATVLAGNALTFANGRNISPTADGAADYGYRGEGLKWDSPVFAGFTASASITETTRVNMTGAGAGSVDGRIWGASLRYAGEFSGVRVAAGLGYEKGGDDSITPSNNLGTNVGGALSLTHVPSGLFLQGNYLVQKRVSSAAIAAVAATATANATGATAAGVERDGTSYNIQAGIGQNWFGLGKTTLYGEYARYNNDANLLGLTTGATNLRIWGLGVTQDIDAAAMQLYAGYRNFALNEAIAVGGVGVSQGNIGIFMAGARVNF